MNVMDERALQEYVEEVSLNYFKKPFKHQAVFNTRLRTTGGRYHLKSHDLDFNPKILDSFGMTIFEGIVKHELCHYHLHLEKKGYRHRDRDFRELLAEVGGLRFTPSVELKNESVVRWEYQCKKCQIAIYRKRRFNEEKYVCSQCAGRFKLQGQTELKRDKV